jgi:hypothetical protein
VIFVPFARHYPRGVVVETSPGDHAVVAVAHDRIRVHRDRRRPRHTITIRPR